MAKDRKKLQHIHSSVPDKQPTPSTLEVGEIAVNNSKDQEFLSIKNSEDKVVRFSSDEQIVTIMEKKEVMPYEGLVRGAEGPGGSKDSYNSYGITEGDLKTNKSNLIIKLNQVVAGNTTKHDKVNGAKDIYNNLVNPTTDGGLNDGAGFAIDMSRYAMNGANPSFSSVTTTCHTELNGRTEILGGNGTTGDCMSYLKIDVLTADTKVGTNDTTISGNTTLNVSGTTTENHLQNVTINNSQNYSIITSGNTVIHSNGAVGITAKEDITAVSTENNVYITANKNLCASAGDIATLYGEDVTNVGTSCNGSVYSDNTFINASSSVTINAPVINISGDTVIGGDTYLSGDTYFKPACASITSNELGTAICEAFDRSVVTMTREDSPSDTRLPVVYKIFQNGNQIGYDINIPTSITHLSEWDGSCLNIDGCAKATNFYQTSDMNYKEEIARANFDKVFRASQVPIKQFKFKDDPNHVFVYGVIAQDVEHYGLDEIVLTDEFGKKSVDYTSLTMLKIASLEDENKKLKSKLSELIDRIEQLENN